MDLKPGLTLYNPDLLSKSDLIRGFVARQPLLNDLLDDLRRAGPGGTSQHHLLLGQRGLGKTTLLRRLAFAIEDDGELAQIWQPLIFPEEQYNVATLADFWLNCCDALSDALERAGRTAEFERLDDRIAQVKDKHTAEGLTILVDEAIRLNRRLLLLVDNIDIVLDRVGEEQEWEFRRVLSEEKRLTIIGASSRAIESFYEHGRAFYDYFQVHELKGLEDAEAFELLRHLATTLDAQGVEKMLAEQPGRVRALRLLTGGNPRTLVLLFQVFQQSPESDIQRDLEHLLDLYTPLYKARFEELPAQAQQVVDAMAIHWDPLTAAELAALTSLPINAASAQLKRLDDLGVIEKVPWFGEKKLAFQIGERFFNIWYLMRASRRARRKLVWLVKFMQAWFTEDELRLRAQAFLGCDAEGMGHERYAEMSFAYAEASSDQRLKQRLEHAGLRAVMADDVVRRTFDFTDLPQTVRDRRQHMEAMRKLAETLPESRADWGDINPQEFGRLLLGSPHFDLAEKQHVIKGLSKLSSPELAALVDQLHDDESRLRSGYSVDVAPLYNALARGEMTDAFDWLSASALDDGARLAYVGIHSRVGLSVGRLRPGDLVRAEEACQRMIAYPDLAPLGWLGWGKLLTNHLNQHQEAEAAYRRAIELDPKNAWPWNGLGNLLLSPGASRGLGLRHCGEVRLRSRVAANHSFSRGLNNRR